MTEQELEHADFLRTQQEEEEILKHIKDLTITELLEIVLSK